MKRRILSVILVLCLLITMLPFSVLSAADIIIIAINDTVPFALNEASMPFYSSTQLYIPYTVFNNPTLGVVPSYDSANRTLTLSNQTNKLTFLLDDGIVKDSEGNESRLPVLIRYGIMFVPVEYCAGYFGIYLSYLTSAGGFPVVRLKTGDEVYSDSLFIEKAENMIAYRLSQYVPSDGSPVTPPTGDSQPDNSGANDNPVAPPDREDPPVDDPELPPPVVPQYIYAICGATASLLDSLDNSTLRATFLFPPEQITAEPKLVRHIIGCGYPFGIDLRGVEDAFVSLAQANDVLDSICCSRTALVLCDDSQREALWQEGCFAFSPVEHAPEDGASLLLLSPETAYAQLRELLAQGADLSVLTETSTLSYPIETEPAEEAETTEEAETE